MFHRPTAFVRGIDLHKHPFMQFYLTSFLTVFVPLFYFGNQPIPELAFVSSSIASIFGLVGLTIHYVTGTLESESRRLQVAVVAVVLVSVAAGTGAVLASDSNGTNTADVDDDSVANSMISRQYVGPNITATVTTCTDNVCNVTVTASDWDYYTVATVTDTASERTWQLTPSTNQTTVTVRRNFTNSPVRNSLTVSLPVDDTGIRAIETITMNPGNHIDDELRLTKSFITNNEECVVTDTGILTCKDDEDEEDEEQ